MTDATPDPNAPDPNAPASDLPAETRNWAMACHLMALTGLLGNGVGLFLGPLITWLVKREAHPFIDEHGKEAVNFQLTVLIAMLCCIPLLFLIIGFLLLPLIGIASIVFAIIAGISASNGQSYRYPMTIRFLK